MHSRLEAAITALQNSAPVNSGIDVLRFAPKEVRAMASAAAAAATASTSQAVCSTAECSVSSASSTAVCGTIAQCLSPNFPVLVSFGGVVAVAATAFAATAAAIVAGRHFRPKVRVQQPAGAAVAVNGAPAAVVAQPVANNARRRRRSEVEGLGDNNIVAGKRRSVGRG